MFEFFKSLLGKKDGLQAGESQAASTGAAPGTEIYYSPELIAGFLDDHQQLLKLFGELNETYVAKKYKKLPGMLAEFGTMLRGHLLTENIKLYIYLQRVLANDPENAALIQGFRTEMNGISKTVTAFLKHYGEEDWGDQRKASFGKELEAIGGVLVKRIETEESMLYPLYMPPEAY